jgi:hypothetical protein
MVVRETSATVVAMEQRKGGDWGDKDSSSGYSDRESMVAGEHRWALIHYFEFH